MRCPMPAAAQPPHPQHPTAPHGTQVAVRAKLAALALKQLGVR